jgi:hypothetical protein
MSAAARWALELLPSRGGVAGEKRGGAYKTAGLYLYASASALFALCKITGVNDWSWWRVCLPLAGYVGFNLLYMATGFGYLSWINFVERNGTIETARIAEDENRGHLNLGVIQFALFALGVSESGSPSEALNGFWRSFRSAGVLIAFGSLAIVNLALFWSTNVQHHGKADRTTKDLTR